MEAKELIEATCDAIQIALQCHTDHSAMLTEDDRGDIKAQIESIFVLRDQAVDKNLALLEIACDAAAQFANDYNYQNPTSPPIEPKWIYILVQALLAPRFKPELVSGDVPRLTMPLDSDAETVVGDAMPNGDATNVSAVDHDKRATNDGLSINIPAIEWGPDKPLLQGRKSLWPNHEIKQLVWLHKYKALPQIEAATKLGRSFHSVTNKWSKITKEQVWKDYMAECETMRAQGRVLSRPATPT